MRVLPPSKRLKSAAQSHIDRVVRSGVMSYNSSAFMSRMAVVMWKWELWRHGLSEEGGKASGYNAILFADLDVDVLPSGASFQTTNSAAASQLANDTPAPWKF